MQQHVEVARAGRNAPVMAIGRRAVVVVLRQRRQHAWVDADAVAGDTEGVRAVHVGLAAHLHHAHLAHHRIVVMDRRQRDHAVGHCHDRTGLGIAVGIFADQERGRLPARHARAEILDEMLQVGHALIAAARRLRDRAERIDEHEARREVFDFFHHARQHGAEVARAQVFGQVHVAHRSADLLHVEETVLLLVAQHLQRRLAQHGEEQGAPLGGREGEHDLVRQRGLARTRWPGDQVERKLAQPASEQDVEPLHTSAQFPK